VHREFFFCAQEAGCRVQGQGMSTGYKANEKFSGKGHAAHIRKACSALLLVVRERARVRLDLRFSSRQNLKIFRR
jgi:hypothetical protein